MEKEISGKLLLGTVNRDRNANGLHHVDPHLVENGKGVTWRTKERSWILL